MHPHEHQYCVSCSRSSTVGASKHIGLTAPSFTRHAGLVEVSHGLQIFHEVTTGCTLCQVDLGCVCCFVHPRWQKKNFTNENLAWSSHVKSIGFKWPAWNSGTFRGVRYFLTIVGLPTGRKPLFYLPGCCKAQLKWTANINIEYLIEISHCTP